MSDKTIDQGKVNEVHELVSELEKYRQLVETANDAVVTIDQNHEVVFMNGAAEKMFGYNRNEIMGGDLSPLIPREYRKDHKKFVDRYVRTRQARFIGHVAQVEAEHRDGLRFPISISFSVAETDSELLLTAIMRDLTAEHELAMQVKRAERLAAVGQMVATVSHEIRTPLTLIGGFASQLQKERSLSERGKRKVGIIVEEVARLEKMLSELNDLSRTQPYEWEELEAAEMADHVKELMGAKLKRDRFFFRLHKEKGLPRVVADRNRLSQVLINLVNNAVQASVPGDEIIMEVAASQDGGVEIRVRDFGIGIPAKHMDELFKPFFTTKKRGTGLGLALAKRIVEEHGGRIELHSSTGKGTVATVSLPKAPEFKEGALPAPPAPHPPADTGQAAPGA